MIELKKMSRRKKIIFSSVAVIAVAAIAAAVVVSLLLTSSNNNSGPSSGASGPEETAPAPTSAPGSTDNSTETKPTAAATAPPTFSPTYASTTTTFCVIADAPYTEEEATLLPLLVSKTPLECEFLINLGDIKDGEIDCTDNDSLWMRNTMALSPIVSLVVMGDNEWNDCPDNQVEKGWNEWNEQFLWMEGNWTHNFNIVRKVDRPECFHFLHKGTLFVGLNLVGGRVHDAIEWQIRHQDLYRWTQQLIMEYAVNTQRAKGVVLMAHAEPDFMHQNYFIPLTTFMRNTLRNEIPILYLHGDGHEWVYTPNFMDTPSLLQIEHEGGVSPTLVIYADPVARGTDPTQAFTYDRRLGAPL